MVSLGEETSGEELGAEAKRIMNRHKQERQKLRDLGSLIPIDTDSETIEEKMLRSNSLPLPLRPKQGQSK